MNWYEILADPDTPADGLVSVRLSSAVPATEGIDLLAAAVRRAGQPDAVALWVDGELVGVCRAGDIRAEFQVEYRSHGYGTSDLGSLPGPPPSTASDTPLYRCLSCGHTGFVTMARYAVCANGHPEQQMVRQP